ncbi:rRNA maturation RNase YbeY [Thermodesulfobacteriota bacterium]
MEVLIDNRQSKIEISLEMIRRKAKAVLDALDSPDGELSILIVDDPQIAEFNKQYLNRKGPTNVIAFPMGAHTFSGQVPQLFGDVVISVETAQKEGSAAGIGLEERFIQLMVHGILHLFGYDHEKSEKEAVEMESKSNEILRRISYGELNRQC